LELGDLGRQEAGLAQTSEGENTGATLETVGKRVRKRIVAGANAESRPVKSGPPGSGGQGEKKGCRTLEERWERKGKRAAKVSSRDEKNQGPAPPWEWGGQISGRESQLD